LIGVKAEPAPQCQYNSRRVSSAIPPELRPRYRASKLIGSSVVNDQNEKVGTIEDIIIGRDKVLYAVLQVGGFLHIGGRMVAVPFQSLVLDDNGTKVKLPGATQEALKKLPEFKYTG
jgi:hypothetical protein